MGNDRINILLPAMLSWKLLAIETLLYDTICSFKDLCHRKLQATSLPSGTTLTQGLCTEGEEVVSKGATGSKPDLFLTKVCSWRLRSISEEPGKQ